MRTHAMGSNGKASNLFYRPGFIPAAQLTTLAHECPGIQCWQCWHVPSKGTSFATHCRVNIEAKQSESDF